MTTIKAGISRDTAKNIAKEVGGLPTSPDWLRVILGDVGSTGVMPYPMEFPRSFQYDGIEEAVRLMKDEDFIAPIIETLGREGLSISIPRWRTFMGLLCFAAVILRRAEVDDQEGVKRTQKNKRKGRGRKRGPLPSHRPLREEVPASDPRQRPAVGDELRHAGDDA